MDLKVVGAAHRGRHEAWERGRLARFTWARWRIAFLPGLVFLLLYPGIAWSGSWDEGTTLWRRADSIGLGRITWDITQDRRGLMYFANSKGVFEFDSTSWRIIEIPEEGGATASLTAPDGRVYIGGNGIIGFLAPDMQGKMLFRSMMDSVPTISEPLGMVLKILNLLDGGLAFLFERHLLIYADGRFITYTTTGSFYDAVFDGKTLFVLDSEDGLSRLENTGLAPVPEGNFFRAHAMIAQAEGRLLLVTRDKGILQYDQALEQSESLSTQEREAFQNLKFHGAEVFSNRTINALLSLSPDRHLLSVAGSGLYELNVQAGNVISVNQPFGIMDEEIYGLFQDDREGLWLGTSNGIGSFFPKGTAPLTTSPDSKSPFQAIVVPSTTETGSLPFAALIRAVQGIERESTLFEGTSFDREGGVPTISASPLTYLTLAYEDNALRFLFTANDFFSAETVQFQTYLKGMEEGWSRWSKRPFREYTNLLWHEYTFFVRALRSDGMQSEATSFSFRILPPWYETWWFYASQVGFLLVLLLAAGILRGYGWGENLSDYIVAVVVLVLFVYLDTQTEVYIEGFAEDVLYIKVLLMICMGIMIEPMQGMAKKGFAKVHLGGDVLMRRHQDELTGLGDRVYFNKKMGRAIAKAGKKPRLISLIMLDFDHFKLVNDEHGLECGDEMLVQLTEILRKNARDGDIVARFMGEKFIIGLFDLSTEVTVRVCERIRGDVENHDFRFKDLSLRLRASFGAACYPDVCADFLSLEALLHEVDAALSEAKACGRNRTVAAPVIQPNDAHEPMLAETPKAL